MEQKSSHINTAYKPRFEIEHSYITKSSSVTSLVHGAQFIQPSTASCALPTRIQNKAAGGGGQGRKRGKQGEGERNEEVMPKWWKGDKPKEL
jgi:hypothetical protein